MEGMIPFIKQQVGPPGMNSGVKTDKQSAETFGSALDASQNKVVHGLFAEKTATVGTESESLDNMTDEEIDRLLDFLKQMGLTDQDTSVDSDALTAVLAEMPQQVQNELAGYFQSDSASEDTETMKIATEQLLASLKNLREKSDAAKKQETHANLKLAAGSKIMNSSGISGEKEKGNTHAILEKGKELLDDMTNILQKLDRGGDLNHTAQKVLQNLQKWTALDAQSNGQLSKQITDLEGINQKTLKTWQSMVTLFEKRTAMANKQQYLFNSKVSSADVAKWLKNTLPERNGDLPAVSTGHASINSVPLTKVEQYVIHLQHAGQSQQTEQQQLIDQLQKIIKATDLRQLQNGKTEIKIALRPQNLGDLTIRMNQVNGEMVVKILVHTSAAKEMIESNLHQLKHMFSPHQVVVEREDLQMQAGQSAHKEQSNQSFDDQQHQSQDKHGDFQEAHDKEDDVKMQFADILMNAKV